MAEKEQKKQQSPADSKTESEELEIEAKSSEAAEKIDDLLDEIDSVLEENAEEFVKNYVQKGGE
jgi:ubiquitin-like protein Pup